MRSLWSRVAVLVSVLLVATGCSFDGIYDLPLPGDTVSEENGFKISAEFADALGVVPRSAVMVDNVPIGQVESVTRVGWNARVTMRIREDIVLPDNTEAKIRQTSLLGEKYVALTPPESDSGGEPVPTGRLGPNDVIPMDRTSLNPQVEEVLGALSMLLSGGGIGQLQTITHELNELMDGRTGKIRSVLEQLNTFVGGLNDQRGDIIKALESINGLSETLVAEKDTIADALDAVAPAVTALRNQHSELVGMLTELDKLGAVGTRVISETKDDLIAELRHLEPVLRELSDTGDALVPGLVAAASYPFPIEAADSIRGDFANVVFRLQIKLIPVSEGGLLPTTLNDLTTLCRATPLAPLCGPAGDAIDQLCSLLGALPLCDQSVAAEVSDTLDRIETGSTPPANPPKPVAPTVPEPSPAEQGASSDPLSGLLVELVGGLLGGAS